MTDMPVPKRSVANVLSGHDKIVVVSDPHEQVACVLIEDSFEVLRHVSDTLDRFGLRVEKTMWVDEGQKVLLTSGQSVEV